MAGSLYGEVRGGVAALFAAGVADPLGEFGLEDLLDSASPEERNAAYAIAEAQGRACATTSVVSRIALAGTGAAASTALGLPLAGIPADSSAVLGILGCEPGPLLAVRAGEPVRYDVSPPTAPSPLEPDYLSVAEFDADFEGDFERVALDAAAILARAQLACAAELLGACERMLDDAVGYCRTREQFGSPIAGFQAVAHALAWAATELSPLRALLSASLAGDAIGSPDPLLAMATKALAGQTARRVAQITLQVTGGMGFTWEYPHNRFHRRTLVLNAVAGCAEELFLDMGGRLRRGMDVDSSYPALIPLETFATYA